MLVLLSAVHGRLADRATGFSAGDFHRRSFCSKWSIAQVYSHLGSGAEIGSLALSAARAGAPPPDPWPVWNRWDAKAPAGMVADFALADRAYLEALDRAVAAAETGERFLVPIDGRPWPLLVVLSARLVEMALHEWDVAVVDDVGVEVDPQAAEWLLSAYPLDVAAQAAAPDVVARLAPCTIDVDITNPGDRLRLDLVKSGARLRRVPQSDDCDAVLVLTDAAAWVRLVSGRWRSEVDDARASISGDVPLRALTELFPGF